VESHDEQRPEAARNLELAVQRAFERIGRSPDTGRVAPVPYRSLRRDGARWIKQRRHRFADLVITSPVMVAVFFETAGRPGRV
jgi:plasmid stabilization system protein ParE